MPMIDMQVQRRHGGLGAAPSALRVVLDPVLGTADHERGSLGSLEQGLRVAA
jgi:hypothetical protein